MVVLHFLGTALLVFFRLRGDITQLAITDHALGMFQERGYRLFDILWTFLKLGPLIIERVWRICIISYELVIISLADKLKLEKYKSKCLRSAVKHPFEGGLLG